MKNLTAYVLGIGSILGAAKLLEPKDETVLSAKLEENGFGITKDKSHILIPSREAFNLYDMIEESISMIGNGTDEDIFGDSAISFERLYDTLEQNGFIDTTDFIDPEDSKDDTQVEDTEDGVKFSVHVSNSDLDSMDILTDPMDESSKKVIMDYEEAKDLMTMIHILHLHDSFEESQLEDKYWNTYNKLVDLLKGEKDN